MNESVTISAPQKKAETSTIRQTSQTSEGYNGQTVRILLVDDNADFLLAATRYLSVTPRFEVVGTATSGRFALDQIGLLRPDLVIIDLVMPGMNGIEAARLLKAEVASIRVILTSLEGGQEYQMSAKAGGADGFFTKSDFCDKVAGYIDELFRNRIILPATSGS